MGRGNAVIPFISCLLLAGAACVSTTDLATLEADVNEARRTAFENRKELRDLTGRIGEVGTGETKGAGLLDIAEAFKNIRASQADLYKRLEDLERSFQETTGQGEEISFQNAQNMRVLLERVDALAAQMRVLQARSGLVPGSGAMASYPDSVGTAAPSDLKGAETRSPGFDTAAGIPPSGGFGPSMDSGETPAGTSDVGTSSSGGAGTEVPGAEASTATSTSSDALGMTPVALYRRGYELLLQERKYSEARKVFKRFLKEYPEHTFAGNAQYWLAETFYAEQNYEDAILAYEDVIRKFKGSDKVPAAMLKQGYSFLALMDTRTAKVLLESVVRKYPDSEEANLARKKLAEIEKGPAGSGTQ